MKQVMRESLYLLALQGQTSWLGERRVHQPVPWTYEDFQECRPRFAASSWRGAMAKAIEQGWVLRTLHAGKTGFLLTKKGESEVRDRFFRFSRSQSIEGSPLKTLVLLKRRGDTSPINSGFRQKFPGTWVHSLLGCVSGSWYDAAWVNLVLSSGFEVCILSVDPEKTLPFSLNDWLVEENLSLQRKVFSLGKEVEVLLSAIRAKKYATKKDKQRFGSLAVSGLTTFMSVPPDMDSGTPLVQSGKNALQALIEAEQLIRTSFPA